jgi:uncharacterized protein (TIGR04255 family)
MTNWLIDEPEDQHLDAAQLSLVVCQVRHQNEVAATAATRALKIQRSLGWESELTENLGQEISLNLIDGATLHSASHNQTKGWRYTSADGMWVATVMPDFFALETRAYSGWKTFSERLSELTSAVSEHVSPEIENRVGLRFVNEISSPEVTSPANWSGLIDEKLLQAELLSELGERLRAAMQVIEIRTVDNHSLVMRHGTQSPGGNQWHYIIDSDCSRQGAREFTIENVMATSEELHKLALRAFEMATTKNLRIQLKGGQ